MATANPTMTPTVEGSWRERFKITRVGVFSVLFILTGGFLLLAAPGSIAPEVRTLLTFGDGVPDLLVHTQTYTLAIAVLYLITGVIGLIPLPQLRLVKLALLTVSAVMIVPTVMVIAAQGASANMTQTIESSFRLATPIAIGALAGLWCERSGVVNIAIEGMMLTGAAFGFIGALVVSPLIGNFQGALYVGILIATLAGGLMALLHAWLSITFRTDQIVSGTVINILAIGITSFMRREVLLSSEAARETLRVIEIPLLSDIPIIGRVLFTGKPIYLSMFILVVITHIVIYYTRWGLRTRAVGENPHAADTLGIDVIRNRYINVLIGGLIAGFAGAWFSLEVVGNFDDQMTGGLGFIALAAMIFGKYTPFGALAGALLFGFSRSLNARLQILEVDFPPQFIQMLPYIVTIIVLAGLVGRAVAPKADGIPYKKE